LPSLHFTADENAFVKNWLKIYIEPEGGPQTFHKAVNFSGQDRHYFKRFLNLMDNDSLRCAKARKSNQYHRFLKANSRAGRRVKRAGTKLFNLINFASGNTLDNLQMIGKEEKALTLRVDEETRKYPWELAYDGKEFLCSRFCIGRKIERPNSLYLPATDPQNNEALVIGLDYFWDPKNYLSHTKYEARSVATQLRKHHYHVNLIEPKDATIANIKKALSKPVSVFHFTGHGKCRKHYTMGEKVLLQLKDGPLTSDDLKECFEKAQGAPFLSFLNACETAMEIYSSELVDAFVDLGAENVIGTFWSVQDEPAKLFARRFYKSLVNKSTIGQALLISRYAGKKDSITWPAFVFYGDPNQTLPRA